jgi:hypothetical protein
MKKRLGYTNDEMKKLKENPRNEDVLSKVQEFINKTIIGPFLVLFECFFIKVIIVLFPTCAINRVLMLNLRRKHFKT